MLVESGLLTKAGFLTNALPQGSVTCERPAGGEIYGLLYSSALGPAYYGSSVDHDALTKPHHPVLMTFKAQLSSVIEFHRVQAEPFPVEVPYGPRAPPLTWEPLRQAAIRAVDMAQKCILHRGIDELDALYMHFVVRLRCEVSKATGVDLQKCNSMAEPLKVRKAKLFDHQSRSINAMPKSAPARWVVLWFNRYCRLIITGEKCRAVGHEWRSQLGRTNSTSMKFGRRRSTCSPRSRPSRMRGRERIVMLPLPGGRHGSMVHLWVVLLGRTGLLRALPKVQEECVTNSSGDERSSLGDIVAYEFSRHCEIWRASSFGSSPGEAAPHSDCDGDCGIIDQVGEREHPGNLSAANVSIVSASFDRPSAVAPGNVHLRHPSLVGDGPCAVLALLFQLEEMLQRFPGPCRSIPMHLLEKRKWTQSHWHLWLLCASMGSMQEACLGAMGEGSEA